jgi:hypothetical protein
MAERPRIVFHMSPDMRMPREILEEAFAANGFVVMGEGDGEPGGDLLAGMRTGAADALIVREDSCGEDEIRGLLAERPAARVLAIAPNGDSGSLYELRAHRVHLADLSPQALVDAIKGNAP